MSTAPVAGRVEPAATPSSPAIEPSLLLTAAQYGRLLGVAERTLWGLDAGGKIPRPLRLSAKCTRWRRDEVEAHIRAGMPSRAAWESMSESAPWRPLQGRKGAGR